MARFLQPPAAKPVTDSQKQIDKRYKGLRLQVFLGVYLGYAAYYLVRKNFTLAMPFIKENYGFSESQLGLALAFNGIGYGISKFLMGGVSDRSDARKFLPLGLILASVATIIAGTALGTANIFMMALLQFLIGWFGGMGWPPCGSPAPFPAPCGRSAPSHDAVPLPDPVPRRFRYVRSFSRKDPA